MSFTLVGRLLTTDQQGSPNHLYTFHARYRSRDGRNSNTHDLNLIATPAKEDISPSNLLNSTVTAVSCFCSPESKLELQRHPACLHGDNVVVFITRSVNSICSKTPWSWWHFYFINTSIKGVQLMDSSTKLLLIFYHIMQQCLYQAHVGVRATGNTTVQT